MSLVIPYPNELSSSKPDSFGVCVATLRMLLIGEDLQFEPEYVKNELIPLFISYLCQFLSQEQSNKDVTKQSSSKNAFQDACNMEVISVEACVEILKKHVDEKYHALVFEVEVVLLYRDENSFSKLEMMIASLDAIFLESSKKTVDVYIEAENNPSPETKVEEAPTSVIEEKLIEEKALENESERESKSDPSLLSKTPEVEKEEALVGAVKSDPVVVRKPSDEQGHCNTHHAHHTASSYGQGRVFFPVNDFSAVDRGKLSTNQIQILAVSKIYRMNKESDQDPVVPVASVHTPGITSEISVTGKTAMLQAYLRSFEVIFAMKDIRFRNQSQDFITNEMLSVLLSSHYGSWSIFDHKPDKGTVVQDHIVLTFPFDQVDFFSELQQKLKEKQIQYDAKRMSFLLQTELQKKVFFLMSEWGSDQSLTPRKKQTRFENFYFDFLQKAFEKIKSIDSATANEDEITYLVNHATRLYYLSTPAPYEDFENMSRRSDDQFQDFCNKFRKFIVANLYEFGDEKVPTEVFSAPF